jgi:hypothetical protein
MLSRMSERRREMTFDECKSKLDKAQAQLDGWHRKLSDPRKFQPIMKIEWGRAFDKREALKTQLCRLDRDRYATLFPNGPNDR